MKFIIFLATFLYVISYNYEVKANEIEKPENDLNLHEYERKMSGRVSLTDDYSLEAKNNEEDDEDSMENYSLLGSPNAPPPEVSAYLRTRALNYKKGFNAWAGRRDVKRGFNAWAGKRSLPYRSTFLKMRNRRRPWGGSA